MINRGYSVPLQRVVTDFGADISFCQVPEKVREHCGIDVAVSTLRRITQRHARAFFEQPDLRKALFKIGGSRAIIAETDGSMVPVVQSDPDALIEAARRMVDARQCRFHAGMPSIKKCSV